MVIRYFSRTFQTMKWWELEGAGAKEAETPEGSWHRFVKFNSLFIQFVRPFHPHTNYCPHIIPPIPCPAIVWDKNCPTFWCQPLKMARAHTLLNMGLDRGYTRWCGTPRHQHTFQEFSHSYSKPIEFNLIRNPGKVSRTCFVLIFAVFTFLCTLSKLQFSFVCFITVLQFYQLLGVSRTLNVIF